MRRHPRRAASEARCQQGCRPARTGPSARRRASGQGIRSTRGGAMLGVGIDFAEEFHVVALGRPGDGVFAVTRVDHCPTALEALVARINALEPNPAAVRVVLETSHGALVERLLDAGYVVVPVNPDLVARRRGPARKKDDATDARIACLLALDCHEPLRPLI